MSSGAYKAHIAVVGCSHGEVDKIYEVIQDIEQKEDIKVRLVLCCGDFQSVRNMTDLRCMACPIKYQAMHDFHRYYSGKKQAPIPTLFIGGNHEASNFLQELPYGGWVAPNIYYCGYVNVLKFGKIRIASLSGIYKGHDYIKGRYEIPPYDQSSMRSVYHYRNFDVFRLKQVNNPIDVVLSHDWPLGIHAFGNTGKLLRNKPFFRQDIQKNELGSKPLYDLLQKVRPKYWFSAHLHVKFPAIVNFDNPTNDGTCAEESSTKDNLGGMDNSVEPQVHDDRKSTRFLALDKVLPHRQFLQILEIPVDSDPNEYHLSYDAEWLAILKSTDELISTKNIHCYMPNETGKDRYNYTPSVQDIEVIEELFENNFKVPANFCPTAPAYEEGENPKKAFPQANPQTVDFCKKLEIRDPLQIIRPSLGNESSPLDSSFVSGFNDSFNSVDVARNQSTEMNPDEIDLDSDGDDLQTVTVTSPAGACPDSRRNKLVLPSPTSTKDEDKSPGGATEESKNHLDILRSVMGPGFGLDDTGNEVEQLNESGLSFVLDRNGEPNLKRRRNIVDQAETNDM